MLPSSDPLAVETLPLFPLGTAVFPGGLLSLQIFELRYLQMIGQCEREGTHFGVVTLRQGGEVHRPGAPANSFETIGTRMRLENVERPQPGLLHVVCRALDCFEVQQSQQRGDGLWTGTIRTLPAEPEIEVPEHLQYLAQQMAVALERLRTGPLQPEPWPLPWRPQDCGWLSRRWAELLPLPLTMKYRLLALRDPLLRLELIGDMVQPTGQPGPNAPAT